MKQSSSKNENVVRSITPPQHDSRWKWMAVSSAAIGAATPAASSAGQVQIDLPGSFATVVGGVLTDNIRRDVTGDGVVDLIHLEVEDKTRINRNYLPFSGSFLQVGSRRLTYASPSASTGYLTGYDFGVAGYTSRFLTTSPRSTFRAAVGEGVSYPTYYRSINTGATPQEASAVVPVFFSDARINAGARTRGFVHCRAFNLATASHQVEMLRLIFNDASTGFGQPFVNKETDYPAWVPPTITDNAVEISKLKKKIKKLKQKQKKLKKAGKAAAATKIGKKIKKLKKKLKAL